MFLQPAAFAAILGVGLHPLNLRIRGWIRGPGRAALLSTIAVLLLLVLPAGFMAAAVSSEMASAGRFLAEKTREVGGVGQLASHVLQRPMEWLGRHLDLQKTGIQASLESLQAKAGGARVGAATLLVGGLAGFAGQTIVTFFVLFFLFRDGPALISGLVLHTSA